jgi:hypothetical protein
MDGKAENSSGLDTLTEIIIIRRPTIILKVNNMSNKAGGSGNTNIDIIKSTNIGIPSPDNSIRPKF